MGHRFRLVNVFAQTALSGNALCVFEDGRGLSTEEMQAFALQLNLSETTFVLPSTVASARVRIFTPSFEMPFAGHPTLGTAHVVRALSGGSSLTLEMVAGVIPVSAEGDVWTLRANAPRSRPFEASATDLARTLGLETSDLGAPPLWVDAGSEQLVVPLVDAAAVSRCSIDGKLLAQYCSNATRLGLVYVWAREGERVRARFFFLKGSSAVEDPGTGSACANLGGWLVETKHALPIALTIEQGAQTGRPCTLHLRVDERGQIFVSGKVIEVGHGELSPS